MLAVPRSSPEQTGPTQSPELAPGGLGVGVSVMEGVGNKQNPLHPPEHRQKSNETQQTR